jgi:hypothetical protein
LFFYKKYVIILKKDFFKCFPARLNEKASFVKISVSLQKMKLELTRALLLLNKMKGTDLYFSESAGIAKDLRRGPALPLEFYKKFCYNIIRKYERRNLNG